MAVDEFIAQVLKYWPLLLVSGGLFVQQTRLNSRFAVVERWIYNHRHDDDGHAYLPGSAAGP